MNLDSIVIRPSSGSDYKSLAGIAVACPPLVEHTAFTYWVHAFNYQDYVFVAEHENSMVGFASALPSRMAGVGLFIWQIGVLPDYRRIGIGKGLLGALVNKHPGETGFTVTVETKNMAGFKTCSSVARSRGAQMTKVCEDKFPVRTDILRNYDEILYEAKFSSNQ